MNIDLEQVGPQLRDACIALEVKEDQRRFVSPVSDYLDLCERPGSPWHPFAILCDGNVVGFVMHGVDPADGSAWIGGLVVDRAHQRSGIGRAVVALLVARAAHRGRPSALSYEAENTAARTLYQRAGFVEAGETDGDEIVARRAL